MKTELDAANIGQNRKTFPCQTIQLSTIDRNIWREISNTTNIGNEYIVGNHVNVHRYISQVKNCNIYAMHYKRNMNI